MTTNTALPISKEARDLLLMDIQNYSHQAQLSDRYYRDKLAQSEEIKDKAMSYLRDAEEYRAKISETMRIIELIDNHNLNFPSTQSKEN